MDDESDEFTNECKHIEVLQRRIEWLSKRIRTRCRSGLDASLDEREVDALSWAVKTLSRLYVLERKR